MEHAGHPQPEEVTFDDSLDSREHDLQVDEGPNEDSEERSEQDPDQTREEGEKPAEKPFALTIVGPEDPQFAEAEAAEARIFDRAFNNSEELLGDEYGAYRDASVFVIVRDQANERIAGIIRIIKDSPAGFKSLNDLAGYEWNRDPQDALRETGLELEPDTTIDIATLGIEEGYRLQDGNPNAEGWVSLALFHGACKYVEEHGMRHLVAILDDKVLPKFDILGKPFKPYANVPSKPYLGSPSSTPVWMDYLASKRDLQANNPDMYDMVIKGKGIGSVVDLPADNEAVERHHPGSGAGDDPESD